MDCKAPMVRWWSEATVAVVTGGNRGIGLEIVRRFAELGLTVVLTARDVGRGSAAAASLGSQGLNVEFCQLDVADPASISAFVSWLRRTLGGLDILVNNAGTTFNELYTNSVEHAEEVIRTNFSGTRKLTEALLPLFRRGKDCSRILNMSSQLGLLNKLRNSDLKEMLGDEEGLTVEKIEGMVARFLEEVKRGTWEDGGWPEVWTDYAVSKLAVNAYSRLLAKQQEGRGLSVNCLCPGVTRTRMTGGVGSWTARDAAAAAARLALLPVQDLPTGKFYKRCTPLSRL